MRSSLHKTALRLGACVALVFSTLTVSTVAFAQAPAEPAAAGAGPAPGATKETKHSKSMLTTIEEGGWVMIPLGLCSVVLIWLTVDLWMRTGISKLAPSAMLTQVQDLFRAGDYVGAYQFCKNNPTPFTDISRVALSFLGDGQEPVEYALHEGVTKINAQIQTRINYLSVIGVCTPMIGLVGTVTGMMKAFETLGSSGVGDPSSLAGAIGEVLIATASGLFIAIPAFMFFYLLRNRLQAGIHDLQEFVTALFRKMPYSHLKECHVGEEEFYAAVPNWVAGGASAEPAHA
jgi:biopolymer transport protein ExbB